MRSVQCAGMAAFERRRRRRKKTHRPGLMLKVVEGLLIKSCAKRKKIATCMASATCHSTRSCTKTQSATIVQPEHTRRAIWCDRDEPVSCDDATCSRLHSAFGYQSNRQWWFYQNCQGRQVRLDGAGYYPKTAAPRSCVLCGRRVTKCCVKFTVSLCKTKGRNCFLKFHTDQK